MPDPVHGEVRVKRRKRGETRAMLVDACIDLIREQGLTSLTTDRVARRAGISQPGFYNHFKNIDALMREAVGRVFGDLAAAQTNARRTAMGSTAEPGDFLQRETIRRVVEATVSVLVSEPRFAEIFLRYRKNPTLLDGTLVKQAQQVKDALVQDSWELSQRMGARPESYARVAIYCEQLLALHYEAGELILGGDYRHELVVDATSDAILALAGALQRAVNPDPQ